MLEILVNCHIIFHDINLFRAIFFPFKSRIRRRYAIAFTLVVVLCALALQISEAIRTTLIRKIERQLSYFNNVTVLVDECVWRDKEPATNLLITHIIGIWIPMLIVVTVHIIMYLKLRREAKIISQSSSSNTNNQMQRISKTFLVTVIVFFICLLPWSVMHVLWWKFGDTTNSTVFIDIRNYSLTLANTNSCLNPFIYSKLHQKIFVWGQRIFRYICKRRIVARSQSYFLNTRVAKTSITQEQTFAIRMQGIVTIMLRIVITSMQELKLLTPGILSVQICICLCLGRTT